MSWPRPIRVVGVGSPNGDDAVAWNVVAELRKVIGNMSGIDVSRIDGGQRMLDLLDGQGSLVLIDAMASDQPAGSIVRFSWPDDRIESMRCGSTHDFGPHESLRLASSLGIVPKQVEVIGIVGRCFDPHAELTLEVRRAVSEVVQYLVATIAGTPFCHVGVRMMRN